MRSGRVSLGGNILRDNNRLNIRSPSTSTVKRRASLGGTGHGIASLSSGGLDRSFDLDTSFTTAASTSTSLSNEPKKDRRAMLEEWRAQVRARENGGNSLTGKDKSEANGSSNEASVSISSCVMPPGSDIPDHDKENHKRLRMESSNQSVGTSTSNTSASLPLPPPLEGATAVERFRMRRKQRLMQQSIHSTIGTHAADDSYVPDLHPNKPSDRSVTTASTEACSVSEAGITSTFRSSICFDDDSPFSSGAGRMNRVGSTPILNRRMSMLSGGARRRTGIGSRAGRKSVGISSHVSSACALSQEEEVNINHSNDIGSSAVNLSEDIDNVDQPGLKSRLILMEKRIQVLEKEKMELSMSKAPLEARLRQKEDLWLKDQAKYEQEINALKTSAKEETEKLKSVENELEEVQEENRRLRYEIRKRTLGSSESENGPSDNWSRRVQHDKDIQEYKEKLRSAEEEIKALRLEKVSIESEINATNMELSALMRDFEELQEEYDLLQEKNDSNVEAAIQLDELTKEHTATLAQLNATAGELASLRTQSKFEMEKKERHWQEEKERMMFDLSVLKSRAATNDISNDLSTESEDIAVLRARIEERDRRIEQLEAEILKGEQIRREMHNTIQELRGNIRVYVRTRPFLPGDDGSEISAIDLHPDGENLSIESKCKKHDFKFDKVFPPSAGQDAVFDEVSEFVQSALDGYHVCLFSYGQTGSGKTHTMQGSGTGAMRGIIPRAVEQILCQAKVMQQQKWKFTITASFLEIYNEELKDLLVNMSDGTVAKHPGISTRNQTQNQTKLSIRRERDGKSYVAGLRKVEIDTVDAEEGMQCLKNVMAAAARARSVASTKMNEVSSRSHSVFMLHLNGTNEENGTVVEGALNLCDLAGSERLDRSGAGSDVKRLKETQSINKSLSCLGDVFTALANGASHVPFRNSKLTYLLQDCLSGDGKALMFVNLSPTLESSSESLCSLRFAQRVNQVELGKATKHISYSQR